MARAALLVILLAAATLRVWGLDFGLPHTLARPDEEAVFSIALQAFQRHLDPQFFDWPSLYLYIVSLGHVVYFNAGRLLGWFAFEYDYLVAAQTPGPLFLIARGISAAMGTLAVVFLYRAARRLCGHQTALIAALFLAVAPLAVRDAHFGVPDTTATTLVVLSFLFAVRYWTTAVRRDAFVAAAIAGLAASAKYNAGLALLPVLTAVVAAGPPIAPARDRVRTAAWCTLIAAAAFLGGTPYAILEPRAFVNGLQRITAHLAAGDIAQHGPAWQVHLQTSLWYGLGGTVFVAAGAGLVRWLACDRRAGFFVAIFPVTYFAIVGSGETAFARYVLPLVPFLCLTAAYMVTAVGRSLAIAIGRTGIQPAAVWALTAAVAADPAWSAVRSDRLLAARDSRLLAADWIARRYPEGETLYQSGATYGQVQLETADRAVAARFSSVDFDETSGTFRHPDGSAAPPPRLIVVQEHPLPYADVPPGIRRLVASDYRQVTKIEALDASSELLVFDEDDALYLPLAGFERVERPGPNLIVYERPASP